MHCSQHIELYELLDYWRQIDNLHVASFHDPSFNHEYDGNEVLDASTEIVVRIKTITFIDNDNDVVISNNCGLRYGETLIGKKNIL